MFGDYKSWTERYHGFATTDISQIDPSFGHGLRTDKLWVCVGQTVEDKGIPETRIGRLGGGFKYFLFLPLFGEDYHFDQ